MKKVFKFLSNFKLGFTCKFFFYKLMFKLTKKQKYREKIFAVKLKFLDKHYGNCLKDVSGSLNTLESDYKVWMIWWQGLEGDVPPIIKACMQTIKENFKGHQVVVITKDNYNEYFDLPDYILKKVDDKVITLTHLSDIVRACLLSKYGGVWIDSTVFMTESIESDIAGAAFYSNKLPYSKEFDCYVGKAQWSAFFLAGGKKNPIFENLKDVFFEYWKTHDYMIDYFLIDYVIKLSYDKFDGIKKLIDNVPINNVNIHNFTPVLLEKLDEEKFDSLKTDTKLFKLTYKIDFSGASEDSFYKFVLNGKKEKKINEI